MFFGALGAQIARASEALGESPDGTVRPVPTALEAQSLHVDTSALTPRISPPQTRVTPGQHRAHTTCSSQKPPPTSSAVQKTWVPESLPDHG